MRSKFFLAYAGGAFLTTLVFLCCFGSNVAQESKGKKPAQAKSRQPKSMYPKSAMGTSARRSRPPAMRIHRDVALAKSTNAKFRELKEMEIRYPKDVVNLRLSTGLFDNANFDKTDPNSPEKFALLCYNNEPVGPTIRVKRGAMLKIDLHNELSVVNQFPIGPTLDRFVPPNPKALKPMDLCSTNLHTHGLHVSPLDPADNIFRSIEPGKKHSYQYSIGKTHPAGTFWYHPHLHGSVAYQLSNGLAGALIVEGPPFANFKDLEQIKEVKEAKERVLVFQLYNFVVGDDNVGRIDASTIYNVTPDTFNCPSLNPPTGNGWIKELTTPQQAIAINGVICPEIDIAPCQVQRWRLIYAGWDAPQRLTIVDENKVPVQDIAFYEIALDGIATGRMEQKDNDNDKSPVELAPGQRSDVLIRGPELKKGEEERSYFLLGSPPTDNDDPTQTPQYLAKITVKGKPKDQKLPNEAAFKNCPPFKPVVEKLSGPTFANGTLFFSADDDTTPAPPVRRPHYTIGNMTFGNFVNLAVGHNPHPKPIAPIRIRLDTKQEWAIVSDNNARGHPFHIHVNPFQVMTIVDSCNNIVLISETKTFGVTQSMFRAGLPARSAAGFKTTSGSRFCIAISSIMRIRG